MHPRIAAQLRTTAKQRALIASVGLLCAGLFVITGCQADEPVGHSKTTTKQTIDTPTEKTTVTETHEKDTKVYPR